MRTHPALRLTLLIVSSTVACSELGGADLARSGSPAEATPATTGGEAAPGSPALPPGAPGSNASGAAGVGDLPAPNVVEVRLVPEVPSTSARRVAFALPLAPGALTDATRLSVRADGAELPASRRGLAAWPDGSLRSVAIQLELPVPAERRLEVRIGAASSAASLTPVPIAETLVTSSGVTTPGVWAVLPPTYLAASRFAGPSLPSASVAGTPASAWDRVCDYARFGSAAFDAGRATQGNWLYDRPTALFRGYQRTGDLGVLRSAYREARSYLDGITGTDGATRVAVAPDDLKYHYTQGLALHYLLTGDERFREAAENVAVRAHALWTSPGYEGGSDFWTERHAGFALLAYEWAAAVSDDRATTFIGWANAATTAYLATQASFPATYASTDARCFGHQADAHGEGYGYVGCSPWMSAILADGLDTNADRRARAGDAAGAADVRGSLVRLGRFVATRGRDASGKPLYWAGVGVASAELDEFDEHWGESAYVVALAWHWGGKSDAALSQALGQLVDGFAQHGEAGQLRSFNWQCRSAVMAPFYARP